MPLKKHHSRKNISQHERDSSQIPQKSNRLLKPQTTHVEPIKRATAISTAGKKKNLNNRNKTRS